MIEVTLKCAKCDGKGKRGKEVCDNCDGEGTKIFTSATWDVSLKELKIYK